MHESRLQLFDQRLAIVKKQFWKVPLVRDDWLKYLENLSVYEFFYKYRFARGKIAALKAPVSIMVTPGMSADCANVKHELHEKYARASVIAYWRHMPTVERHEVIRQAVASGRVAATRQRLWGGTVFEAPIHHAVGSEHLDRFPRRR